MKYSFETYQMNVENHLFWVAKSKSLKGCVGQGDTVTEAIAELQENENSWLETASECGIHIPDPDVTPETVYSGKLSLRLSSFVHGATAHFAKEDGVSINQYINDAIVYYNGLHNSSGDDKILSIYKEKKEM